MLKEMKVELPVTFKEFMKLYAEKVKQIRLLNEHFTLIVDDKLI